MSHIRLATLVVCLLTPAVARATDASVYLYLQPFPADASKLTFTIASVSVVSTTGSECPLKVNLKTVAQSENARQRLLAFGRLPAGNYAAFVFKVRQAALKNAQGETTLAIPDVPARLEVPLNVAGEHASLFWLTLNYQDSVANAPDFRPIFELSTPRRPMPDTAGFVTNSASNTITVFNKTIAQAVAIVDTCGGAAGMALDQRRRQVYVACPKDDEIQSIDVATGDIVERTRVSPGDRPRELALTPDGSTLVTVNNGSNTVTFFDPVSLTPHERISVGSGPTSLLIDAAGRRAFVFNTLSSSISVIDVANRTVAATISTDASPLRGRFNRRGDRLYVIHDRSPYMTVLDPTQLTVVNRARLRTAVSAVEVDTVRDLVCVGGTNDTSIEFYDPNALMPVYSMRTKSGASYLRMDVDNNRLYMVSPDTRSLLVGGLADRKLVSEIDVGEGPYAVVVMGEK